MLALLVVPASLTIAIPFSTVLPVPERAPRAIASLPVASDSRPAANAASPLEVACGPMAVESVPLATESALMELLWKYLMPSPEFKTPYKTLPETASVLEAFTTASARPEILLLFTFTARRLVLPVAARLTVLTPPHVDSTQYRGRFRRQVSINDSTGCRQGTRKRTCPGGHTACR